MRIVFTVIVLIFLSSCKKDEEILKADYHGKISQSLYPFLFDTGSYWIYKDTITNNLDSTILTSITKNTLTVGPSGPGQGPQGDEEYFNLKYLSLPNNSTYEEQLVGYVISRGLLSGGYTLLSNKKKGEKKSNAEITDILDSLTIEGSTYYNVVKMKILKDYYIQNDCNFYYVDSIGVIKKEFITNGSINNTWNLLRYKAKMLKL